VIGRKSHMNSWALNMNNICYKRIGQGMEDAYIKRRDVRIMNITTGYYV
jgi:hypothetical protein